MIPVRLNLPADTNRLLPQQASPCLAKSVQTHRSRKRCRTTSERGESIGGLPHSWKP